MRASCVWTSFASETTGGGRRTDGGIHKDVGKKTSVQAPGRWRKSCAAQPEGCKRRGKGAGKHVKPGCCLTLLSEATGKLLFKRPTDGQSRALGSPKAAKSAGKGAGKHLKPGYCLTLLSEAARKSLGKRPGSPKAAKGAGQDAGKHCLTLLSEATRKPLFKRPADGQSRALGSLKAAKGAGKGAGKHLKPGYC